MKMTDPELDYDLGLEAKLRAGLVLRRHPIRGGDAIAHVTCLLYWEVWIETVKGAYGEPVQKPVKGFVFEAPEERVLVRIAETSNDAFLQAIDTWRCYVDLDRWRAAKLAARVLGVDD